MDNVILTAIPIDNLIESFRAVVRQEIKLIEGKDTGYENPITGKELCKYLGISEPTLIRWRKKGKIPFLRVGGVLRYDKAAVSKALEKK